MEKFTLDGEKYTIIDGIMFDREGEIIGFAERSRPTTVPPDIALEHIKNAPGPAQKEPPRAKKAPGKNKRETRPLSALLIEDGATAEQAAAAVEEIRQQGTDSEIIAVLVKLADAGTLNRERITSPIGSPADIRNALITEGITPASSRQNFCKRLKDAMIKATK